MVAGAALTTAIVIDPEATYDLSAPFLALLFMSWSVATYNEKGWAIAGLVAFQLVGLIANIAFREQNGLADYFFIGLFISVAWATGFCSAGGWPRRGRCSSGPRGSSASCCRGRARRARGAPADRARAPRRHRALGVGHDRPGRRSAAAAASPSSRRSARRSRRVEATGREALTEMRRLVGLLREQGAMPEFSPQPGTGRRSTRCSTACVRPVSRSSSRSKASRTSSLRASTSPPTASCRRR